MTKMSFNKIIEYRKEKFDLAIIGTFHLPSGMSQNDEAELRNLIAKGGIVNIANKQIVIKNGSAADAETLFTIPISDLPKLMSGDAASVGTTVTVSDDGKIKVDIKDEVLTDADKAVASGLATLDADQNLVQNAKTYAGGTGTIKEKFDTTDTAIQGIQTTLAGLTGAYVYIGKIDSDAPTAEELTTKATTLLGEGKTLSVGHVIVDNAGIEWWYDGTTWVNLGQTIITVATADVAGVVKGSDDVEIAADGTLTVKHAADATTLNNVAADQYVTKTTLNELVKMPVVYSLTATLQDADADKLATITTPKSNDIAIIVRADAGTTYSTVSYIYYDAEWHALCGKITADDVLFTSDITLAGDYTSVGNIKLSSGKLSAKGKTLSQIMTEIFTKKLQPHITANPKVEGFALNGAKAVEAGTKLTSVSFGTAKLSAGSYTYGPETGITAKTFSVKRETNVNDLNVEVATAASGTDNNSGNGFIIGDQGGTNVVNSLKYTVTVGYDAGAVANDNLGGESSPKVQIAAGTKTQTTSAYTPFRNSFYGTLADEFDATATATAATTIRGLTKTGKALTAGSSFVINIPAGVKSCVFAYPASLRDVSSVIYNEGMNSDVKNTFDKYEVTVPGAEGYTGIKYKVYVFNAAGGISARTYTVTI